MTTIAQSFKNTTFNNFAGLREQAALVAHYHDKFLNSDEYTFVDGSILSIDDRNVIHIF